MRIAKAVTGKYTQVATVSPQGMFTYPTGREGAMALGYPPQVIAALPEGVISMFCGVGNPLAIMAIDPGSHLLDVGCGGGCDLLVARQLLGNQGRYCGIDLTPAMIARAGESSRILGYDDIELRQVETEHIPYPEHSFDVVISNGVINLSAKKLNLLREIRRVLRPGGRLQFADIVLAKPLPSAMARDVDSWAQ